MQQITFPKFKDYTNQKVNFIQPKFDGHLVKIYKGIKLTILTKNDKNITDKILTINNLKKQINLIPNYSVLFAELHCPGIFATSVPTMLNNADEQLQISIFAAPLFDNIGLNNGILGKDLIWILHRVASYGLQVVDTGLISNYNLSDDWIKRLLQKAIKQKLEGWVLKESHMQGWYKLKPVQTIDCFVISSSQSFSASFYGGLQSIHVACYKQDEDGKLKIQDLGDVGSGFTKEFRLSFEGTNRFELVDRICEVAYDSVAANGKLRFPRFIRWRDDKNKKDCILGDQ